MTETETKKQAIAQTAVDAAEAPMLTINEEGRRYSMSSEHGSAPKNTRHIIGPSLMQVVFSVCFYHVSCTHYVTVYTWCPYWVCPSGIFTKRQLVTDVMSMIGYRYMQHINTYTHWDGCTCIWRFSILSPDITYQIQELTIGSSKHIST